MIPELVGDDPLDAEAMIEQSQLNIINGFKKFFGTVVRSPDVVDIPIS